MGESRKSEPPSRRGRNSSKPPHWWFPHHNNCSTRQPAAEESIEGARVEDLVVYQLRHERITTVQMPSVRSRSPPQKRQRLSKRLAWQFTTFTGLVSVFCAVYSFWQVRRDFAAEAEVQLTEVARLDAFPSQCLGKEKYMRILQQAGLPENLVNSALCQQLPSDRQVAELYGPEPIIHGLEMCEKYRSYVQSANDTTTGAATAPMVRVTGLHNTGTNALQMALHVNLDEDGTKREITDPDEMEMMYGVPWFKHFPLEARTNWAKEQQSADMANRILTLVLIRDPYRWMQSMVSHHTLLYAITEISLTVLSYFLLSCLTLVQGRVHG